MVKIASIGDVCMDIYPQYHKILPGGTAFNTAFHITRAGAKASIFSAVGNDTYGTSLRASCKENNIEDSNLLTLEGSTSSIAVTLNEDKSPTYSEWNLGVLENYSLKKNDEKLLRQYDAAKIILFEPMRQLFIDFCNFNLQKTLKVVDFAGTSEYNGEMESIQNHINSIDIVIKSIDNHDTISFLYLKKLAARYPDKLFLILMGKQGSVSLLKGREYTCKAIPTTQVQDTNGAGDAYVANFLVCYVATKNVMESMEKGSQAASEVITRIGAFL